MAQVQQVTAPPRKPRAGGIKDVIGEFITESRLAATTAIVWEDSGCGVNLAETRAGCYDSITPIANKVATGVAELDGIGPSFARYAGVECFLGGDAGGTSYEEQARARLLAAEDRAVEGVLATWAAAGTAVTGGNIVASIAALEQYADNNYIGQPILLMSRASAVIAHAARALTREGGRLISPNGTPVIATGARAATSISVIGGTAVYASPVVSARGMLWKKNTDLAIAERLYAIGVDCDFRATATVA